MMISANSVTAGCDVLSTVLSCYILTVLLDSIVERKPSDFRITVKQPITTAC